MSKKEIKITCKGTDYIPFEDLQEFQGEIKILTEEAKEKLKKSILKYGFTAPFFVWKSKILDGHQRKAVLQELQYEGYKIPSIPVVDIQAKDEKEAKEKLLRIASQYGFFNQEELMDFINNLDYEEIEIPDIDIETEIPDIEISDIEISDIEKKVKEQVLEPEEVSKFLLVLNCDNEKQLKQIQKEMEQRGIDHHVYIR